ncbi:lipopolysaccharide transport system ATP-binding protein [Nitrosospira sp. Nsp18]|uniref:ABC transporter ATP-binding protein n=1 Tax=Nitrosospira sp. Nsp18 TaxID=1855334 RepID=UPI00088BD6AD|nr:ABC transporter ATP-binding protein [Nitrosospira sp. Nsp18]SDA21860.1 lipopolysaccharide transport system ATP-binding protein [Nitrosospira sp. Nsp18]
MFSKTRNIAKSDPISSHLQDEAQEQQGEVKSDDAESIVTNSSSTALPSDIAIRVQNLSKCYQIYDTPRDRLKQFIAPRLQRLARRPPKQYFREFWALKDVSFEVKKGETVGIIGRNGSGKSTLLQIICGTLAPTGGSVETMGRIAALLELGSGFNPEFTGRENIYMNGTILGLNKEEIDTRFDDIVAFADIGEFIAQPVKTYSSGMFVRLAFAVNIMSQPQIMVVDEALAVGDMSFQAKCTTALKRIQENGTTVLFVSHDIGSVKNLCSRGIYLERGKVFAIGPAGDIAEYYVRAMREEMSDEHRKYSRIPTESDETQVKPGTLANRSETNFKTSEEFTNRVAQFRYGTGEARITYAELLDLAGKPLVDVDFDQLVQLRFYFTSTLNTELGPTYYVMDDKKNHILGAGPAQLGQPLLKVESNKKYVITFKTRLPLHEGIYSIQLELARPIVTGVTAEFMDVIADCIIFRMARRQNVRIWAKVFIPATMEIGEIEN